MRLLVTVLTAAGMLGGCAFPHQVQRFGVEYNAALAEMQNEQTLLNLLRARDGMPTHFTSVSQFRGSVALTAGASLNAQLRGSGLTRTVGSGSSLTQATTASTTTALASPTAPPSTSVLGSTVTTPGSTSTLSEVIAEGVDLYTPQISGQIVSGTNFDVAVFDTQKFYQGILGPIPFPTVEAFLNQGIDDRLLMHLLVARVDFRLAEDVAGYAPKRGANILSLRNSAFGTAEWNRFDQFVSCNELGSGMILRKTVDIAAMSRFTRGADGKPVPLALDKIAVIDGERYELSSEAGLSDVADQDGSVVLRRVTAERRVARLAPREPLCTPAGTVQQSIAIDGVPRLVNVPAQPQGQPIYLGDGRVAVFANGAIVTPKVDMEISFRSTEGVFRYLGNYLAQPAAPAFSSLPGPLISICEGSERACGGGAGVLARASYGGSNFRLINSTASGARSAQVFTLLHQLVNLHKEAADKPVTIPVRAIP